ncbi:hypothetical protein NUW54_g542 [Trametes sanguinea]|uniref:Uncharacterized protein n=1 Tax=Trametes sanguinea TaxID=158606 RepID=A0ACC1QBB2_9APHY|nr:hypothetical protein NUW54_g542 [Trametes sanguinea]
MALSGLKNLFARRRNPSSTTSSIAQESSERKPGDAHDQIPISSSLRSRFAMRLSRPASTRRSSDHPSAESLSSEQHSNAVKSEHDTPPSSSQLKEACLPVSSSTTQTPHAKQVSQHPTHAEVSQSEASPQDPRSSASAFPMVDPGR